MAEGEAKSGRSVSDIAVIRAVMTIVGDTDEERNNERVRASEKASFSEEPTGADSDDGGGEIKAVR